MLALRVQAQRACCWGGRGCCGAAGAAVGRLHGFVCLLLCMADAIFLWAGRLLWVPPCVSG